MKTPMCACAAILAIVSYLPAEAMGGGSESDRPPLVVGVRLNTTVKLSRLKPGDKLAGRVDRTVFAGRRELLASGSPIELTVSTTQRRRERLGDRWPWVIRLCGSRQRNYPAALAAVAILPDGSKLPLPATFISTTHEMKLTAQAKSASAHHASAAGPPGRREADPGLTVLLRAERPESNEAASSDRGAGLSMQPERLDAGTVAHVMLMADLRASTNHTGDAFVARLTEPVCVNSKVILPEGVLISGTVVRSVAPRWLSRSGSMNLTFSQLQLPSGQTAITASPSGLVVDRTSGLRMNSEGGLRAAPGTARLLLDLAVTGGISKVADDSFQLIAEALISTATDASTAGAAKIVSAAISGIYLVTRHGRDVVLPRYTNMEITFEHPVWLQPNVLPASTSANLRLADNR